MNIFYILIWTPSYFPPIKLLQMKDPFVIHGCYYTNCIVTTKRSYFGRDIGKFHAIIFDGVLMKRSVDFSLLRRQRRWHQKFVFVTVESAHNHPVMDNRFNDFFNWTMTYRLDSDILYPYMVIKDKYGRIVGPQDNMHWEKNMVDVDEGFMRKIGNKSRAAAWFVSHCLTKSRRESYGRRLDRALRLYGYFIDIYGKCGPMRKKIRNCDSVLESDYYFYLSFENSISKDYVTEKLLTALQHKTVPIVLGGANYSRFLPPGSYLNAHDYAPHELAYIMRLLMMNSSLYRKFFRWTSYYSYEEYSGLCNICAALNNRTMMQTESVYKNFKNWWNY